LSGWAQDHREREKEKKKGRLEKNTEKKKNPKINPPKKVDNGGPLFIAMMFKLPGRGKRPGGGNGKKIHGSRGPTKKPRKKTKRGKQQSNTARIPKGENLHNGWKGGRERAETFPFLTSGECR